MSEDMSQVGREQIDSSQPLFGVAVVGYAPGRISGCYPKLHWIANPGSHARTPLVIDAERRS